MTFPMDSQRIPAGKRLERCAESALNKAASKAASKASSQRKAVVTSQRDRDHFQPADNAERTRNR